MIESLINMDVGTSKTLRIPVAFDPYDLTRKKVVKNLMDLDALQLTMIFRYEIHHNKINEDVFVEFD
jgi:hypothetical protein